MSSKEWALNILNLKAWEVRETLEMNELINQRRKATSWSLIKTADGYDVVLAGSLL